MPIQGSGAISISDLVGEFAGQAPHSLTEYYRNGSLVDSTRDVSGSATKSDGGTTTDFAGVTGLSVTRTTGTVNATSMSLSGSSVTVPAGAYVDFTVRRRGGRSNSAALGVSNIAQGPDATPNYSTKRLSYQTTLGVSGGGSWAQVRSEHEVQIGPSTFNSHSCYVYRSISTSPSGYNPAAGWITGANKYWTASQALEVGVGSYANLYANHAGVSKTSGYINLPTSTKARTENAHALQSFSSQSGFRRYVHVDVFLRIKGFNNTGSNQTLTFNGTAVGQQEGLVGNAGQAQNSLSLTANSGGNQTVYTYAVTNNTGSSGTVTVGGVDTVIANGATTNVSTNNSSSSLAISFQSTVTLNSSVPTSGAISLTDFYGAEEQ
tara:strand:- start:3669 stop:4802 length:1134 start_codon:yes stop_codon:yes gene_type:complete